MTRAGKIVSLAIVLLLVLLALPFPLANVAVANTLPPDTWVAKTGNDTTGDGTQAKPWATIGVGINNVAHDGTVHVAAGTYHENLDISEGQDLTGVGASTTIIDGSGSGRVLNISSAVSENTITGFTIQSGDFTTVLWNPADEQVLFAGINLRFIQTLPRLFGLASGGGGIYIGASHTVTLNDCVIKDNQAEHGGGIYNQGQLTMNGCTISGNSATTTGGGIYNSGNMELTNCTISGNQIISNASGTRGAGICNAADMTLVNCTVANNTTTDPGCVGGGFWNNGTATFMNTIVANNRDGNGQHNNGFDTGGTTIVSLGHNLDSENSCGFNESTDLRNTNPLLGPLQDNGGPTFTHALLHGSPAIDAGSCATTVTAMDHAFAAVAVASGTDQRGVPRPQGAECDIGAYELTQSSVATATGTGTASFSTTDGFLTGLTALTALPCPPPSPNLNFPHGYFSFTVNGITPGSSVTVVIILPSPMPVGTEYWKCINGQWVDCTSLLGSNDGDSVLTLTITDGALGDRDGKRNGTIVDPGGPVELEPITLPAVPRASPTLQRPLNPAQVSLQYLSVTPQQTSSGQPVTISTNVVNTGDEAGNLNVALKINGQIEQNRMVSVGPQGTQPVKFTITKAQPGTYTVDIGGQKGSFTINGAGGTTGKPVNGGMIAILIVGILVLITIVLLAARRRPA